MDVRVGMWRMLSAEELMVLNCGVGEDSWESLGLQGGPTSPSPKGDQPWVFIGRTDIEAETPVLWPCDELTHWKRLWCWEGLGPGGKGDNRGWDGRMASPTRWTWVWVNSRVGEREGGLACHDSWGCKEPDMTEWLNWTELNWNLP